MADASADNFPYKIGNRHQSCDGGIFGDYRLRADSAYTENNINEEATRV